MPLSYLPLGSCFFKLFEDKHFVPPELLCGEIEISMLYAKNSQKQMCPNKTILHKACDLLLQHGLV